MLNDGTPILAEMAWPAAILIAWVVGETCHRWLSLPRISGYGIAGFAIAASQGGFLENPVGGTMAVLADFAFALMLFELGYRINLRWLRSNPWLGVTSVVESGATFAAVFLVARGFALELVPSLLLAALAMATSPAAILRVVNELRSSGQVTERLLHLSAFNCVLAVIVFKAVLGYWVLANAGSFYAAAWSSVAVVAVSAGIGALFGVVVPAILRTVGGNERNATAAFAIAALLLTVLTHAFKFSPLLAALSFGLVARNRRVMLSQAQRDFGTLGDVLTVVLFVYVAASLHWQNVVSGIELAVAVIVARLVVKTAATALLARPSGLSLRKGALTGLAMMPMSVFVIQLIEQTRHLERAAIDNIAGVAAIVLLLEVMGPLFTHRALRLAGETQRAEGA